MKKTNSLFFLLAVLILFLSSPLSAEEAQETVQFTVKGITLDPLTSNPIVLLEDLDHKIILPIWIGSYEANAISLGMKHIIPPRPMTHDLLKNILDKAKVRVEKIILTDLEDDIFYAVILLEQNGSGVRIDSRPSDAIALALKTDAPIFVSKVLLEKAESIRIDSGESLRNILQQSGLVLQELTPEIARYFDLTVPQGVLVSDVRIGSSAESAGIKRGDVIRKIGKRDIVSLADIRDAMKGENKNFITLHIERNKKFHSFLLKYKK
jgi:bifunctional DNase/RNase